MIENANFSDALEFLRDNPWLAHSKSYSRCALLDGFRSWEHPSLCN